MSYRHKKKVIWKGRKGNDFPETLFRKTSYLDDFEFANLTFTMKIDLKNSKQNNSKFNPKIIF